MKVENVINIYRINGSDTTVGEKTKLFISNCWNKKQFVELRVGEGLTVVIKASDLKKAIENSINNDD